MTRSTWLNCLEKLVKNEWSRETLNRWINGKCSPKSLTLAEEELLRKMLPEAPAHHLTMPSGLLTCLLDWRYTEGLRNHRWPVRFYQ